MASLYSGNPTTAIVRSTADVSYTSNAVPAVDAVFSVNIGANEVWTFDYTLFLNMGGNVGGFQFILGPTVVGTNNPTITSSGFFVSEPGVKDGSIYSMSYQTGGAQVSGGVDSSSTTLDNFTGTLRLSLLIANGAAVKTIAAQFAQFTSSATPSKLLKDSYLIAHRVS